MTTFVCAISNECPEVPVVSPVSGMVYERRLVEKYIAENGVDPINRKPLTVEDLVELKVAPAAGAGGGGSTSTLIRPKPPSATSIPAILKSLQDEWDAVMLHSFTLRQQVQTARQELSHSLYQHDAACRVIARLIKELAAAREALATLKPQQQLQQQQQNHYPPQAAGDTPSSSTARAAAEAGGDDDLMMGGGGQALQPQASRSLEPAGMSPAIVNQLQEKAKVLTGERRKKSKMVPEDLATADDIKSFRTLASHPGLHSASAPGILAVDICPDALADGGGSSGKAGGRLLTGGVDKNATVFDKDDAKVVAVLKGHTKKISRVVYHCQGLGSTGQSAGGTAITASYDATIRIWDVATAQTLRLLRVHEGPVTGLSLHATGDYLLSTGVDQHWAFSDIRQGQLIARVTDGGSGGDPAAALTCAQFHPDGLIFGTGTSDAVIKIWDLKEQRNVANFEGHTGQISALSFSENGYYLATAADDSSVKLWDLRKLKNFKTIQLDDKYEVKDLCFDQSGTYLAVAGTDVRVYLCKQWQELKVFHDHTAIATGVRFGRNASFLASTSMDRTLKIYGL